MRNGFGTMFYANGAKFVGNWVDNKKQGKGSFYNKYANFVKSGVWNKDKFDSESH
jgi:hypothetical protein